MTSHFMEKIEITYQVKDQAGTHGLKEQKYLTNNFDN